MKLCVFSDSHGAAENLIAAIRREKPALCFFLGDGERDLAAAQERFPDLPFFAVRGNCDLRSKRSASLTCTVGGVAFFAAHGHLYDVKYESDLQRLTDAARETGADAALFGHTHRPFCERRAGILCLNPGTLARGQYAVLTVADGTCEPELKTMERNLNDDGSCL